MGGWEWLYHLAPSEYVIFLTGVTLVPTTRCLCQIHIVLDRHGVVLVVKICLTSFHAISGSDVIRRGSLNLASLKSTPFAGMLTVQRVTEKQPTISDQ